MEINLRGKSYKIAWEYCIAPFLIIVALIILIITNYSKINRVWISLNQELTAETLSAAPEFAGEPIPARPHENAATTGAPGSRNEVSKPESNQKAAMVNINKAGMEELMTLPFIGEVKARAIIDYRNEHGPFKSVDELDNIKGIGAKTLEKLRPYVITAD